MIKKKDSLAVNRHIAGRYPRSCLPFDSRRDRSRQGCWNGTEKERMQWRAVYGGGLMSRRRYILEQVFTRAGCTRYLHTFGSSGARSRSYVRVYAAWSLERERKRGEKKVNGRGPWERDPHGCFSLSRCWFRREKIDSGCTQVLAILFFFPPRKNRGDYRCNIVQCLVS